MFGGRYKIGGFFNGNFGHMDSVQGKIVRGEIHTSLENLSGHKTAPAVEYKKINTSRSKKGQQSNYNRVTPNRQNGAKNESNSRVSKSTCEEPWGRGKWNKILGVKKPKPSHFSAVSYNSDFITVTPRNV